MTDLTKTLYEYAQTLKNGTQIVTVDWSEAARDFSSLAPDAFDVSDARWTKAVGTWVADHLLRLTSSYDPTLVSEFLHSHGNAVGYYIANVLHEKTHKNINLFVGLDPAKNPGLIGGRSEVESVNMGQFSRYSIAFDSSWLGSSHFSATADRSYVVQSETDDVDTTSWIIGDAILQHGAAVTTFASIVRENMKSNPNIIGQDFHLGDLLNGGQKMSLQENILAGDDAPIGGTPYEGEIVIRTAMKTNPADPNDRWLEGTPITFQWKNLSGNAVRESVTGVHMKDAADKPLLLGQSVQSWVGDLNRKNIHSFDVTQSKNMTLTFGLPKPGTYFIISLENTDSTMMVSDLLVATTVVNKDQSTFNFTAPVGHYRLMVRQIDASQSLLIAGNAANADVPYQVTLQ